MIDEIVIYVEADNSYDNERKCRRAFETFFSQCLSDPEARIRVVVCGNTQEACEQFVQFSDLSANSVFSILLIDSDTKLEVTASSSAFFKDKVIKHWFTKKDKRYSEYIQKLKVIEDSTKNLDEHIHFMVQEMEAWFFADPDTLENYKIKGKTLDKSSFPNLPPEEIKSPSEKLDELVKAASANTGKYKKIHHAMDLLYALDCSKVRAACPHFDRLIKTLEAKIAGN